MPPTIRPPMLSPGDRVAAVSLSWGGPGTFPHRYRAGVRQLEAEFGLQVVEMPHTLADPDWLARNPRARADDLLAAFADPSIRAVFSTIGGDDSIRLLPYIDLQVLRGNPKIFLGFSNSAITHLACWKAGLTSFYGPSIMAGFGENGGLFPYMVNSLRRTLFSSAPVGVVPPNPHGWTVEMLGWDDPANQSIRRQQNPSTGWRWLQGSGLHRGRLLGGCIEVLDWLRGTDFWPPLEDWQDALLFLETSEDAPTPQMVTSFLRTYAALGILPRLAGILFARPGGGVPVERFAEYDAALLQVVRDEEGLTNLPIVSGMDFGHTDPVFTLPYGVLAELNCTAQTFTILESAVHPRETA